MNEDKLKVILKALWEENNRVPVAHNAKGCRLDLDNRKIKDNIVGYITIEMLGLEEAKELLETQILCEDYSFPDEPHRDLLRSIDHLKGEYGMEEYVKGKEKHGSWSQAMGEIRKRSLKRRGLDEDGKPLALGKSRRSTRGELKMDKKYDAGWSKAMDRIRVKALKRRGLNEDGDPISCARAVK